MPRFLAAARPAGPEQHRVRLRTLVTIRWLAIAGQCAAVVVVRFGLGYPLPLNICLLAISASAALNIVLLLTYPAIARLSDGMAALHLGYDMLQLTALLYLTGGVQNPFIMLMALPVTIAASILSRRSTIGLAALAVLCVTALSIRHWRLPWGERPLVLDGNFLLAFWLALLLTLVFVAAYAFRVAEDSRRMSDALVETQLAMAREQQMSALGSLAAAAAHELGTPLGTIAVVAKELSREIPAGSPLLDDVRLLGSQAQRCREILARLSHSPDRPGGEAHLAALPLEALLSDICRPYEGPDIELEIMPEGNMPGPMPEVRRQPEILHGLGNLVQNAAGFATQRVEVAYGWNMTAIHVHVRDDGPGFDPEILEYLGEPYLVSRTRRNTARPDTAGEKGMGLGVFIAKTLLERTGATLEFENRPSHMGRPGGAQVSIWWPRGLIEAGPSGYADAKPKS